MAPLIDDNESPESDKKPPAKRQFYAVRKCDSLRAPAIFLNWKDCSFYVEIEENDGPVEYQTFDVIIDAFKYIVDKTVNLQPKVELADQKVQAKKPPEAVKPPTQSSRPSTAAAAAAATTAPKVNNEASKTRTVAATVALEDVMIHVRTPDIVLLKAAPPPASTSALAAGLSPSLVRKRVTGATSIKSPARKKNKTSPEKSGHVANGPTTPLDTDVGLSRNYADDGVDDDDGEYADDGAVDCKVQPYKDVAMPKSFVEKIELMKAFKIVSGHVNVNRKNCTGQFKELITFVSRWRRKVIQLEKKNPSSRTRMDKAKIYHLTSIGLDLTSTAKEAKKAQWEHFFKLLTEFKEQHGTIVVGIKDAVAPEMKELHQWYKKQREAWAQHQDDPTSCLLTEDQNQRMVELGFVKSKRKNVNTRCNASSWDETFLELKAFVEEHGHMYVPAKSRLSNWCSSIHRHYDRMKQGKTSQLNPERIAKLLQLGFSFDAKAERLSFDERAVQWLEYKTKHGHEPKAGHMLAQWVRKIRSKYKMLKAGEKTSMTQEQADKLTAWGFKWESAFYKTPAPTLKPPRKSWQVRFEELCQYKEEYGHCVVPQQDPVLGLWVNKQRREYTLIQDGKPSGRSFLTKERIAKLKDIGFVFLTRKRPRKSSAPAEVQKKPYDYTGQDGSSSDDDDDSEDDRHGRSYETPRAAARGQDAFVPWDA